MNILHLLSSFTNGGIETMLVNVANQQTTNGHNVSIIIFNNDVDESLVNKLNPTIRLIRIHRPVGSKNPFYILKLNYCYKQLRPEIVHFHNLRLSKYLIKRRSEKWFFTCHATNNTKFYVFPDKRFTAYIAISKAVLNELQILSPKTNNILCYNGIDFTRIRNKTSYRDCILNIVCVSRLIFEIKGQNILIQAIDKLNNYKNIHIDFIGDGPDLENAKTLVDSLNLKTQITFLGNKPNDYILSHLRDYDLLIQPSIYDGFGLTAIEAMGCGLPVLLSDVDGLREVSLNGQYATLTQPCNDTDLANKIIFCSNNYSTLINKALAAQSYVINQFSTTRQVDTLDSIYKTNK